MNKLICMSILVASNAFASELFIYNVSVRKGFSLDVCARKIQSETSANIIQVLSSIRIISINASEQEAARVEKIDCVEAIEKDESMDADHGRVFIESSLTSV